MADEKDGVPDDFIAGHFVKLYGSIVTSSVWVEPHHIFRVWVAMLALADADGCVPGSPPGLASLCRVTVEECEEALGKLSAPDKYSRTKDNEGRRIEAIPGGWRILNHRLYRDIRTQKQVADAERIRRKRESGEYDSRGPLVDEKATRSNVATEAYTEDRELQEEKDKGDATKATRSERPRIRLILDVLKIPQAQRQDWGAMIEAMTQGMGTPRGMAVNPDTLMAAAQELAAEGGDVTSRRYKGFVADQLRRLAEEKEPRPRGGPAKGRSTRTHEELSSWLNERQTTDAEVIEDGE